ncbi:MAG: hypothetical protein AAFN94_12670 [Pseudomonadota bacterium]
MTLVIQRLEHSTEIYVSADAPTLFTAFAADPTVVPMTGPHIDFDAFFEGTWDVGDALLADTDVTIAGSDAGFEAMSFMLHPISEKLPLRTRIDGMVAMSVCNTIEPGAQYLLDDLQAYVGYFSDHGSDDSAIEFRLPETPHAEIVLQVYDITPEGFIHEYQRTIAAGEPISFDLPAQPNLNLALLSSVGLMFLGICGAIAVLMAAARTRRT